MIDARKQRPQIRGALRKHPRSPLILTPPRSPATSSLPRRNAPNSHCSSAPPGTSCPPEPPPGPQRRNAPGGRYAATPVAAHRDAGRTRSRARPARPAASQRLSFPDGAGSERLRAVSTFFAWTLPCLFDGDERVLRGNACLRPEFDEILDVHEATCLF